ncbi:MAG: hypothetical protein M3082_22180 [Candidatus Dormibacteraeota bacterium]|nr:hypothetical protein [Candidatus Dormibacteraeota bacterium]
MALLIDDPPTSGDTLARAAGALRALGFRTRSIVPLVPTFNSPASWNWPERLRDYDIVQLPSADWAINQQLEAGSIRGALTPLLEGRYIRLRRDRDFAQWVSVGAIGRVVALPIDDTSPESVRGHRRARYRVEIHEQITGRSFDYLLYVKGVGLGYFGRHGAAVAEGLRDFLPQTHGVTDGLLFREWLPEDLRLPTAVTASTLAAYAARRRRDLPLPDDAGALITGRDAMWERCSDLLTPAFRSWAPVARLTLRNVFRHLVASPRPSLIDGSMRPEDWFYDGQRLMKVHADEGTFWSGITYCSDAVYDLAAAAVSQGPHPNDALSRELRREYEHLTQDAISNERWLLYQLLHLQQLRARALADPQQHDLIAALGPRERQMSRLMEGYLGSLFLSDVPDSTSGPLCAIDIDGVLDTTYLSFPATTPCGALALRALIAHGYRPVLSSGRSLAEVHERCEAYRLTGGSAEYGSALWVSDAKGGRGLLPASAQFDLDGLRRTLAGIPSVHVDPAFQYIVRAYCLAGGRRQAIPPEVVASCLATCAGRVYVVPGKAQTDFVAVGVDKGSGMAALANQLGCGDQPLALAVGDTLWDLPPFQMAARAIAPGNAEADLRVRARREGAPLTIARHSYQLGLFEAVSTLIRHRPGACSQCAPPRFSRETNTLLAILYAQDGPPLLQIRALRRLSSMPKWRPGDEPRVDSS